MEKPVYIPSEPVVVEKIVQSEPVIVKEQVFVPEPAKTIYVPVELPVEVPVEKIVEVPVPYEVPVPVEVPVPSPPELVHVPVPVCVVQEPC